jgi:uncharacterized membrane protein
MSEVCASCGTPLAGEAEQCPGCGATIAAPRPVIGRTGIFRDNVAGSLAYVTFIPAIIFLLREPYKRNRFIRFHAWQSMGFTIAIVLLTLLSFFALGHLIVLLACTIGFIGVGILWLLLLVKALQGEMFKVPVLGDLAEKQVGPSGSALPG